MTRRLLPALLLGLPLATLVDAALLAIWGANWSRVLVPVSLLLFPLWTTTATLAVLSRSARCAWLGTGLATVAALVALVAVRHVAGT